MPQKRVLIVVNKWWECDPVMNVLLNPNARPGELGWPLSLGHPRNRPNQKSLPLDNPFPAPRTVFGLPKVSAAVFCISDLLEDYPDRSGPANPQSSSEVKMKRLPR